MTDHALAALGGILGGALVAWLVLIRPPRHPTPRPEQDVLPMTKSPVKREPVLTAALASLIVWVALRFGLPIDNDLADALGGVIAAAFTAWARSRVTPVNARSFSSRRPTFLKGGEGG